MPGAVIAGEHPGPAEVAAGLPGGMAEVEQRRDVREAHVRPCAPIGGTTWAASATSAVRGPSRRSAICATIGQSRRGPASLISPRMPQARSASAASKSAAAMAASVAAFGPSSIHTTAERWPSGPSGSGTSVKGPPERWISVEASPWGSGVRDGEDHRLLPVAPAPDADPERLAHEAVAAVRRDDEPRPHLPAVGEGDDRLAGARGDPLDGRRCPERRPRQGGESRHHLAPEQPVRQVVPEDLCADLAGAEVDALADLPRRPAGVDDAHRPERRRLGSEPLPEARALEQRHRRQEEGGAPQVRPLRRRRGDRRHGIDAGRLEPRRGEGRRRRQAGAQAGTQVTR